MFPWQHSLTCKLTYPWTHKFTWSILNRVSMATQPQEFTGSILNRVSMATQPQEFTGFILNRVSMATQPQEFTGPYWAEYPWQHNLTSSQGPYWAEYPWQHSLTSSQGPYWAEYPWQHSLTSSQGPYWAGSGESERRTCDNVICDYMRHQANITSINSSIFWADEANIREKIKQEDPEGPGLTHNIKLWHMVTLAHYEYFVLMCAKN